MVKSRTKLGILDFRIQYDFQCNVCAQNMSKESTIIILFI